MNKNKPPKLVIPDMRPYTDEEKWEQYKTGQRIFDSEYWELRDEFEPRPTVANGGLPKGYYAEQNFLKRLIRRALTEKRE